MRTLDFGDNGKTLVVSVAMAGYKGCDTCSDRIRRYAFVVLIVEFEA